MPSCERQLPAAFAASGLWILRSVTVPDNSTFKDANATEAAIDEKPGGHSGLNTNVTVGIVAAVVGIFVGLLGAVGVYFWRRRNNRAGTLGQSTNVEGGTAFFQSANAPDSEFVFILLHH